MRKTFLLDAIKKSRKNLKKNFQPSEELSYINNFLNLNDLKRIVNLHDSIPPLNEVEDLDYDCFLTCQQAIDQIKDYYEKYFTLGLSHQIDELMGIFSTPHFRAFLDCLEEINSRNFYIPSKLTFPSTMSYRSINALDEISQNRSNMNLSESTRQLTGSKKNLITGGGTGPFLPNVDAVAKMITIEKNKHEDLGISVKEEVYNSSLHGTIREVVISRIMADSKIYKQGTLHVGDVIREVNGIPIDSATVLQDELRRQNGPITLKIIPAFKDDFLKSNLYVRAHFSYDSSKDSLIPTKEGGLSFRKGDVLQVIDQTDPYWWQAKPINTNSKAGLIPSEFLQERRKAHEMNFQDSDQNLSDLLDVHIRPEILRRKKQVKVYFSARNAEEYQSCDLRMYEEVALISGFQRPVICMTGASGVGRRTLMDMLIKYNPERYSKAIPYTSRPKFVDEVDGEYYHFDTRLNMEEDNRKNKFLEFCEYEDHYYGLKFESILEIIDQGKTCLLECHPKTISLLRNSEYMPYSVFIAAPAFDCLKAMYEYGRSVGLTEKLKSDEDLHTTLETSRNYERRFNMLFDKIVLCDNIETTYEKLCRCLDLLLVDKQWVPAAWLY